MKDTAESQKAGVTLTLGPKPNGGVSGDLGWQSGVYTVKDKTGKVVETGKYLSVSMKKGGKWLYVRDTWNADNTPTPAESAAPCEKVVPVPRELERRALVGDQRNEEHWTMIVATTHYLRVCLN